LTQFSVIKSELEQIIKNNKLQILIQTTVDYSRDISNLSVIQWSFSWKISNKENKSVGKVVRVEDMTEH